MALRLKKNFDDLPDRDLLKSYLQKGDLEILGSLYKRYIDLVYGVCLKYLKSREDSEDAVMEIFEKLIIELEKHRVDNFKSWLYVLTRNYCLMKLRSDGKDGKRTIELREDKVAFMESDAELHPIDKDNNELDGALKDCISKLKEEQHRCIELFYFENRCYREIADLLKLDEKKVKSHLQNAKRNIKLCLEKKDE